MRLSKGITRGAIAGAACAVVFAAVVLVIAVNTPPTEMGFGPSDAPYLAWAILVIYGPPASLLGAIIGGVWVWLRRRGRIKRGLCPACAYPVGTSPVCTECGKPVIRKQA